METYDHSQVPVIYADADTPTDFNKRPYWVKMPLLSSETWVFALAETPGIPSLRACLPGKHLKKRLKKSYQWLGDLEQLNAQF